MSKVSQPYVSNRVLKLNVGFLLHAGSGLIRESALDVPQTVRVAEDVTVDYLNGIIRLSRTKEGILLQGALVAGVSGECYRCLDPASADVTIALEELYGYPHPIDGGFFVGDDGIMDIAPLVRAEVLIATTRGLLCKDDCKGLCAECGENLNHGVCACHIDEIDPRMAKLKQLLDSADL